ncbi:MAG: ATP-binding cassette domain-containing protein [Methanobacteriota archaeon]
MIRCKEVVVRFPAGAAVGPFTFEAGPGVTLLTGPSGCGKSTLLRAISGVIPAVSPATVEGFVSLADRDPTAIPPAERPQVFAWLPQDLAAIATTPWEEVAFALERCGLPPRETQARVDEWLGRLGARSLSHRPVADLSGGERARVLVAAALAPGPRVLLLDEPLAQLDPWARDDFLDALEEAVPPGTIVLAATHRPELWDIPHDEVRIAEDAGPQEAARLSPAPPGPPVANLSGATVAGRPGAGPFDVAVGAGEAVAVAGDNGSGKTTMLWLLAGLLRPSSGTARLAGRDPAVISPRERARLVGLAFQEPAWHLTADSVRDEAALTLGALGADPRHADRWLSRFGLSRLADRHPWDLSGGERQRLAVVTALAHEPALALLDEPTRGMDALHRDAVLASVRERTERGLATVVVTHDERLAAAFPRRLRL